MGNCCFFKSTQVNHRSSTTLTSSTPGTSKPNNNGGGFVGSNLANSRLSKNSSFEELYPNVHILPTPNLKIYSFAELKIATKNFRQDTVLGEGGFGTVYKGLIEEKSNSKMGSGSVVAVKKLNSEGMQGLEEGQSEVNFLGRLSHPNLVKLLGYCLEDKELLLVYEFIQKGCLENHLFRNESNNFLIPFKVQDLNGKLKKVVKPKVGNPTYGFDFVQGGSTFQPLAWNMRLKIALGAARGLAFLHTSEKTTMYRDFTASNILLDGNYNPKLSDFGLAKNGPLGSASHVTTRVMGTYGYAAPKYIATGHLYVKSDVFGFGVVLLEMLSGQRAVDKNRPSGLHNLVDWLKPSLADRRKLKTIMDPRLEGQYPPKAAVQAADLTLKCLGDEPRVRPSMKEVVEALERIVAIRVRPKESRPGATRSAGHRHVQHHHCSPINPMHEGTGTSQNSGSELKKMIKKSRSIKRSDPVTSTKRRTKPQSTNKSPPPTDVPVAAPVSTPKKLNLVKLPETSPMRSTPIKLRDASPNHMKPTPVKLPVASPNYMKSTTSSYNARKERSLVSPQGLVMRMV